MQQQIAISGRVQRFIRQPADDGFGILAIATQNGRVTALGRHIFADLSLGDEVELSGSWKEHDRFGRQFAATDAQRVLPTTASGLVRWLVQMEIPGVGEATAKKLVDAFGADLVERVAERDDKAAAILGERLDAAAEELVQRRAEAEFGPLLAAYQVGPDIRAKIISRYGETTRDILKDDPYRLIMEIDGVAFPTADRIAVSMGSSQKSPKRLLAAGMDTLRRAVGNGDTATTESALIKGIVARTGVSEADAAEAAASFATADGIVATTVKGQPAFALSHLHYCEAGIAARVIEKVQQPGRFSETTAKKAVAKAEKQIGTVLNAEQRAASIAALSNSISIMTGGPGTGKTHTLNVICRAMTIAADMTGIVLGDPENKEDIGILNASPTGKAANRMRESTGIEGSTLHRLLQFDGEKQIFMRNMENPIETGLVAIDETSMGDVVLMNALARAWGDAQVLLIGDPDQLPSVYAGRVLGDLIASGVVPTTELTEIRRQAEGSEIALGAAAVRKGEMPQMGSSELIFIESEDDDWIAEQAVALAAANMDRGYDTQILTAGHNGTAGTREMNRAARECVSRPGQSIRIAGGAEAAVGDKVIHTKNDTVRSVFNGDCGTLSKIVTKRGEIVAAEVTFADRTVSYTQRQFSQLELSYALSIHKAQGSEYDVVVLVMTTQHYSLLSRPLFYTGLTRGKKKVVILGSKRALQTAIRNDDNANRVTTLQERLAGARG